MKKHTEAVGAVLTGVGKGRLSVVKATVTDEPGSVKVIGLSEVSAREMQVRLTSALGMEGHSAVVEVDDDASASLDFAAAVAVMRGMDPEPLLDPQTVFVGEISLGGAVRPVRGGSVLCRLGPCTVVSADQTGTVFGRDVMRAAHLSDVRGGLQSVGRATVSGHKTSFTVDFLSLLDKARDRNALFVGSPGCGKTLLARACVDAATLLSEMQYREVLDIYSCAGLEYPSLVSPFRAPHHTASAAAMLGKGSRPGEVALAHLGVLFLDEINEFPRATLEAVREALKEYTPFAVYAAANPCPRGCPRLRCKCTEKEKASHMARVRRQAAIVGIEYEIGM